MEGRGLCTRGSRGPGTRERGARPAWTQGPCCRGKETGACFGGEGSGHWSTGASGLAPVVQPEGLSGRPWTDLAPGGGGGAVPARPGAHRAPSPLPTLPSGSSRPSFGSVCVRVFSVFMT